MGERTVDEADLESGKAAVLDLLKSRATRPLGEREQPLAGGLEFVLLQVLVPILVALTSTLLAEVLKGKVLGSMSRRQTQAALDELMGRPLAPRAELDEASVAELCRMLGPYGVREDGVRALYARVLRDVTGGKSQNS